MNTAKFKVGDRVRDTTEADNRDQVVGIIIKVKDLRNSRWSSREDGTAFEYSVQDENGEVHGFYEKWLEEVK